ncbi:MAG: hypothetical protein MJZ87_02420 [Bacteroidales bacterium]|mgnify:CR=1 FL=1|nr:hypothetical protein [Bacteroidales bacterium]
MKKLTILTVIFCAVLSISAQNAKESMINFGKQQLAGYLIDVPNADVKTVEAAFRDKLEKQYNLKASKESGFRAYLNQPFSPFGKENYDIYFTVGEYGKKKNRTTQLSLIVCSGNKNTITSQNNPETADYVKVFLRDFVNYVNEYALQQKAKSLEDQISKLTKEKKDLTKEQEKINKQIEKLNKELEKNKKDITNKESEIEQVESELKSVKKQLK